MPKSFDIRMQAIIAASFAPFEFFVVPGFPNFVPIMDEGETSFPDLKETKMTILHNIFLIFMKSCINWVLIMNMSS
jgi:hypothetical protein